MVDNTVTALTTQTLMGQSVESNALLSTKYSLEVKGIKGSNFDLVSTFTKMKVKMSAMGNDLNFDSDKKEDMDGEYGGSFKKMINNPKGVTIDGSGKIMQLDTVATKSTGSQPDMMQLMMDQMLGDPAETGYGVNTAFVTTPGKIIPGYNWTDSSTIDGIQKSTTYKVKEIKGNDAVIVISGILNTDVKSQMQGMNFINRLKGNLSGEEMVDLKTGVIKERITTLESTGIVLLEAQAMEIPMTTKITFSSFVKPS